MRPRQQAQIEGEKVKRRKGQITLLTKPILLVLTIGVLGVLVYSIYTSQSSEKMRESELDLRTSATNMLTILASSEDCLGYVTVATMSSYANIVDVKKLEEFSERYAEIEPPCARSYQYGWRAKVIEINKLGERTREWSFGAAEFSKGKALSKGIITNMPIGVKHSEKDIRPGSLEIELVDGDLERVAGFLDMVCEFGRGRGEYSAAKSLSIVYPAYFEEGRLCNGYGSSKACRRLLCENVEMENINAGNYYLRARYYNNTLYVSI